MTVAEGGGKRAVWSKFQEVYIPALKANYMVWPLVQVLNFRVMPIQFQIVSYILIELIRSFADVPAALREHCGYCVDSVPLSHEFSRGASSDSSSGLTLNDSCSMLPACLASGNSDRIGRQCGNGYVWRIGYAHEARMESGETEHDFHEQFWELREIPLLQTQNAIIPCIGKLSCEYSFLAFRSVCLRLPRPLLNGPHPSNCPTNVTRKLPSNFSLRRRLLFVFLPSYHSARLTVHSQFSSNSFIKS